MDLEHPRSKPPTSDIAEVRVMSKEQHLGLTAQIVKHTQRRPCLLQLHGPLPGPLFVPDERP